MARGGNITPRFDAQLAVDELSRVWPTTPGPDEYDYIVDLVRSLDAVRTRADQLGLISLAGSHGYGLNTDGSDLDIRGLFVMPTREYLQLKREPGAQPPPSQLKSAAADLVLEEAGRFMQEASKAKSNVFEIMWAPVLYSNAYGRMVLDNRDAFLSQRIRDSYGGFAESQRRKAVDRVAGTSDEKRRAKHVRHMLRAMHQGLQLLETGTMDYRLDPELIARIRELESARDEIWLAEFARLDARLQSVKTDLPPKPDETRINDLLFELRMMDLRERNSELFTD
jgi:predicted nucleotidyltransferase